MNTYARPTGAALERLRDKFGEIERAETLLRPTATSGRRIAASGLYAAAMRALGDGDVQSLAESRGARGFYRRTIAASALYGFTEARAASSGATLARHCDGCHIRMERSRAEPDQFFVVVEFSNTGATLPTSLIVSDSDDRIRRFPLPSVRNGVAQMIAEANSDLLRLISDPTTKVYLR